MPDLTFFPDPNVDRVLGVVLELAAEVYVLRDRLRTVELALARRGGLDRDELDRYEPTEVERASSWRVGTGMPAPPSPPS